MGYFYFDETIRERGGFMIGALVVSERDLSPIVAEEWKGLGLDPESDEYKSSDPKAGNELGMAQRAVMARLLEESRLGLVVAPVADRRRLGEYCTDLIVQLFDADAIPNDGHVVYLDESIPIAAGDLKRLDERRVSAVPGSNSKTVGGIQVADHAAHALGGMLLEEMGVLKKRVRAGEDSGYHPDELLDLGFELWASLRYALIGRNEYIEGRSPHPEDPANPYFRVDGVGLYVSSTCQKEFAEQVRARFGVNYLGCIH
jgi:hypothetical protein